MSLNVHCFAHMLHLIVSDGGKGSRKLAIAGNVDHLVVIMQNCKARKMTNCCGRNW